MMTEIVILEEFEAYPDNVHRRQFMAGEKPTGLPEEFVDIIVAKGHAERVGSKTQKKE